MRLFRALAPTVAALAVVLVTVSLGNWQSRRAAEKLAMHEQRERADRLGPTALGAQELDEAAARELDGRLLTVRGRLLPERSVFVDNRTYNGVAGFHVLTPLRIADVDDVADAAELRDRPGAGGAAVVMHVLVLRGWVAHDRAERTRLPALPAPGGPVELTGVAQQDLAQVLELKRLPPPGPSQRIWQNLSLAGYADWSGLRLQPLLIRQTEPARIVGSAGAAFDDGLVRDWPRPGLDVDKHRGYAFQWYAMAVATAALWGWFAVWRPLRARSRRRDDKSGSGAA